MTTVMRQKTKLGSCSNQIEDKIFSCCGLWSFEDEEEAEQKKNEDSTAEEDPKHISISSIEVKEEVDIPQNTQLYDPIVLQPLVLENSELPTSIPEPTLAQETSAPLLLQLPDTQTLSEEQRVQCQSKVKIQHNKDTKYAGIEIRSGQKSFFFAKDGKQTGYQY